MKKLILFNGTSCLELPPQAQPIQIPSEAAKLSKLAPDKPIVTQLTLLPNEPAEVDEDLTALLFESESQYYSTHGVMPLRISPSNSAHIQVRGTSADITVTADKLTVLDNVDVYLNGIKIDYGEHSLSYGDSIWAGANRFIMHLGYIECIGTEYTSNLNISTITPEPYDGFPTYTRSPRIIKREPAETIELTPPKPKEERKKGELVKVIVPPLMMMLVTAGGGMIMGRGLFVLIAAAGMLVSVIFSVTTFFGDRKARRDKEQKRDESYENYLLSRRKRIHELNEKQRESLLYHNLSPCEIEREIQNYSSRLYERASNDSDFLTLSLGYSTVPTSYKLNYKDDTDASEKDALTDEMKALAESYRNVKDMPTVVDLKKAHLGLVGEKPYVHRQLTSILTQLCFFQSYHDIEIILLIEDEDRAKFEWARWYPHCRIKSINITGLVSAENQRDQVLGNVAQMIKQRKQKQEEEKKDSRYLPHYIFIIDNPKLIINHSIMEYLQTPETSLGFSLIYTTHIRANLPENIHTVFMLDGGDHGTLLLNEGVLLNRSVTLPDIDGINFELMARKLTPIRHSQGISTVIPESVTFFELFNVKRPEDIPVLDLWKKNACHKSLAVPLGLRGKDDIVALNLHEKAHGPHGLVAGTTGSGKSEIVQSYILSLAINFHPHEVGFLLIDYKGGGMANLFSDLPHLLGTITNLDGSESMRALASIKSELARRQRILNDHNVNNINQYTKLFKSGDATLPMPHLFLISDEFAELKKEQPDFMSELVSAARIGRSLGVHLILATQKPSGVVDDQIWSNSKFKLALKVANESDSNEVLKTPDAARITQPGRAYLQVGNNEIYELFQSAWSGAPYSEDVVERGFDSRVYLINQLGQGELLNEDLSEVDKAEESKLTELDVVVNHVSEIYKGLNAAVVEKPWLPPLEQKLVTSAITLGRDVGQIDEYNLAVPIGMVDIPEEQAQMEYTHGFIEDGNLAIFGASGFGKSTVLMTAALTLAAQNSPKLLNYFILDYGNSALAQLRGLPHTADYIGFDDIEKLAKLEKLLTEELKKRKYLFAAANALNFRMYNDVASIKLPALLIFIDNYDVVKEVSTELEEFLVKLTRDGTGVGIYTIISASRSNAVGQVTKIVDALGYKTELEYDDFDLVKVTREDTVIAALSYDNYGNVVEANDALERTVQIEYDDIGLPVKVTAPDDSITSIEYDDRGNVISIMDAMGGIMRYEYNELNQVVSTADPNGNTMRFSYNAIGDITEVTNAEGNTRKYEYNANGKVTRIVDWNGSVVSYEYNCMSKPVTLTDQEGNETTLEYDLMWNISKQIDANGNATIFEYDALSRLKTITNIKGAQIHYEYDPNGNRTKIIGAGGEEVSLSYDVLGKIKSVTEPDGAKTIVDYDFLGNVTKLVDPMGNETKFEYDKAGQKIRETDPSGKELKYNYTALGQTSEVTDSIGRKTMYEYLPGGLLSKVLYPDGRSTEYVYDANMNIVSKKSQDGYTLTYEYDCLNQISRICSSTGQEKLHTYDAVGNVTSITDANGNTTKYIYSPNGNLTSVIDPLGNVSEYDYDKLGNLTEVKQFAEINEALAINEQNSKLRITKYDRNELGQVERVIDALGNAEIFTYDDSNNVASKCDKDGFLTKYTYNVVNQIEEIVYADGKSVKLTYDLLKHLTEIKDWLGTTRIDVDELGRAKKVTDHEGREVEYTFGSEGERTSVKYPDGKTVQYRYDEALRLKTLIDSENTIDYSYDANSRISNKVFSNGVSTKYSYNDMGMLSELAHNDRDGILDKYIYTYDNMANKIGIKKYRRGLDEESGTYKYTYDALSRLTGVSKDGAQLKTFGYDEFGNRSHMIEGNSKQTSYVYNALNQLLSTTDTDCIEQSFSYDKRGNLTQIFENGRVKNTYEFGPLNRLMKATNAVGQSSGYDYNGLGFRVGKQIANDLNPTKYISYVLDQTKQYHNLLQMSDNEQAQSYTWDDNVAFANGNAYLHDELGSPLRYVNRTGTTLDSYGYDEFGIDLYGNQGTKQPFGYTGYTADIVAGTYFAQAREYIPRVGRFTAEDSHWHTENRLYGDIVVMASTSTSKILPNSLAIIQSSNLYGYAANNPKTYVDPTGSVVVIYDPCAKQYVYTDNYSIAEQQYNSGNNVFQLTSQEQAINFFDSLNMAGVSLVAAPGSNVTLAPTGIHYSPTPSIPKNTVTIIGISGYGAIGAQMGGNAGIMWDNCGNIAGIINFVPAGGVSIGASVSGFLTTTDVPCISILRRADHIVESVIGFYLKFGGSYTHSFISVNNDMFHGSTLSIGKGIGFRSLPVDYSLELSAQYPIEVLFRYIGTPSNCGCADG